jgi:hypothetical protein
MKTFLFSNKILGQLPTESAKKLRFMTVLVVIMALLGGCFGGIVAIKLLDKSFIIGFTVMFTIILLLESFMAMYSKKQLFWLRILVAIILATINALGLDAIFFEKDINNYYTELNEQKIIQLDNVYANKANTIHAKIADIEARSDSLYHKMNLWSNRIFTEINSGIGNRGSGEGKFAKKWTMLSKQDSIRFAPQLQVNTDKITSLNQELKMLETEKQVKIDDLIAPTERGLSERLSALEHLIFYRGSRSMQIFYVIFFLLCLFLECLVIIMKRKFTTAYQDYGNVVDSERTYKKALSNYNRLKNLETEQTIIDERHRLNSESSLQEMQLEHQEKTHRRTSQHQRKQAARNASNHEYIKVIQLGSGYSDDEVMLNGSKQQDNPLPLNGETTK